MIVSAAGAPTAWGSGNIGGGLSVGDAGSHNRVDSGWDGVFAGDFTVAWYMNLPAGRSAPASLAYIFSSCGSFRCFTGGVAGQGLWIRAWGGTPADLQLPTDIQVLAGAGWTHIACSIDGTAGTATWYVNGAVSATVPGVVTGSQATSGNFLVGQHSTSSSFVYDLDDFLFATRAYSAAEIAILAAGTRAADGAYGSHAAGANCGALGLGSIGGLPALGNSTYGLDVSSPSSMPLSIGFGTQRCSGSYPFDLGLIFPAQAGCMVETTQNLGNIPGAIGGGGSMLIPFPVPNLPGLQGVTIFSQALGLNLTNIEVSNGHAISIGN